MKTHPLRVAFTTILTLGLLLVWGLEPTLAKQPGSFKKQFKDVKGGALAVSDGNGQIRLVFVPPGLQWPSGGWRIEEQGTGRVVRERLRPGDDVEALNSLPAQDQKSIRDLPNLFGKSGLNAKEREIAYFVLTAKVTSEWSYARAAGLGLLLPGQPSGKRSYRIIGLDAAGKPLNIIFTTKAVDPSLASNLPRPPSHLKAEAKPGGVALFWVPPAGPEKMYVTTYVVERGISGEQPKPVTDNVPFYSKTWDPKKQAFFDTGAPLETDLTYHVLSVDALGRKSAPATISFFAADVLSVGPPAFSAKPGDGQVVLSWKTNNPHTAGFVLERSFLHGGPYTLLTPKPLAADELTFIDKDVHGGTTYFYRIRSVNSQGIVGKPSDPTMTLPRGKNNPPRPNDLKADAGRTRVRLTWEPVRTSVAGYMVERKAAGAAKWIPLNARVVPEPEFNDNYPLHTQGSFSYRVKAVAYDNKESEPSRVVDVVLPDTRSPSPPFITSVSGKDGKVNLTFQPSPPETDVAQFLVLRSVAEDDPGLVLGDFLSAGTRKFEDPFVKPGQKYWYRIVALDKAGNRSDPGEVRTITVENSPIPKPGKPNATYEEKPVPHVTMDIAKLPKGLQVVVERQVDNGPWQAILGPLSGESSAADLNLPKTGRLSYRLVYQTENGIQGESSEAREINR